MSVQGLVGLLWALIFALAGSAEGAAAAVGGLAILAGNAASVHLALDRISPAKLAFGRLMLGAVVKWLVAITLFAVGLVAWKLPPLPMLSGFIVGLLAYLLALNLPAPGRNKKG